MIRTAALPALLGSLLWCGPAAAQTGAAKPDDSVTRTSQATWVTLSEYSEKTSRAAFRSCDDDGDDRLDVREARSALPNMGDQKNPVGFRTLDANRNGFVHWNEFDDRFRRLIEKREKFVFRPSQPFVQRKPKPVDRTQSAVDTLMNMVADDENPEISEPEFRKLLRKLGQPTAYAKTFPGLDQDKSGGLSAEELKPIVAQIPALLNLAPTPSAEAVVSVSRPELRMRLNRMHPALGRWSGKIFQTADRDGNGTLSGKEIDPSKK